MADVQIAVIDQQNTEVTVAVPGIQGIQGQTGDVAVAQDGTAGTPGIRFENDTNTGIYRPGANQIAISTGGTGRLFVDASGNVGVGLSPTWKLDVSNASTTLARFTKSTAGDAFVRISSHTGGTVGLQLGDDGDIDKQQIRADNTNNALIFNTANNERLRITSDGKVGLGTSAPSVLFQTQQTSAGTSVIGASLVNNSATLNAGVILDLVPATAGPGVRGAQVEAVNTGSNEISLALKTSSGGNPPATRLHITPAGNVGVGTTSPTALLDVSSSVLRLRTAKTPASATDTGNAGDICWDANYVYVCTATNTWKRSALSTW